MYATTASRVSHRSTRPNNMAASIAASSALSAHVLGRCTAKSRRTAFRCRAVQEPASISAPVGFVPPEPRKFTVAQGSLGRVVSSAIPLVLRGGTGALISGWFPSIVRDDGAPGYSMFRVAGKKLKEASALGPRPAKTIEVFEYEGSPYCRKVREAAAVLDLDVLFRPCPSGETYWRAIAKAEGAKTFPYVKDPNTGLAFCESDDIVEYLFRNYGPAASDTFLSPEGLRDAGPATLEIPMMLRRGGITNLTCYAAALVRLKGLKARPSRAAAAAAAGTPVKPVELWTYEGKSAFPDTSNHRRFVHMRLTLFFYNLSVSVHERYGRTFPIHHAPPDRWPYTRPDERSVTSDCYHDCTTTVYSYQSRIYPCPDPLTLTAFIVSSGEGIPDRALHSARGALLPARQFKTRRAP